MKTHFLSCPLFLFVAAGYSQQNTQPQQVSKGDLVLSDRSLLQRYFPKEADAIANGEQISMLFDKNLPLKQGIYLPNELQALVGKQVALVGSGAPPGGSNDLIARNKVYIRVITDPPRDLRPHSASWEIAVFGTIQGFVPSHRIIVIEVTKKDWKIVQTL